MISIGILEDDPKIREQMYAYLDDDAFECEEPLQIDLYDNADMLLEKNGIYDILLLDIYLGEGSLTGMETAREIRKHDQNVLIIFVTNLSQFALQGYQVNAFDFIVKPLQGEYFRAKMENAVRKVLSGRTTYITIRSKTGLQRIRSSSIHYVEVFGHNIVFHTDEGEIHSSGSMTTVESMLDSSEFFRCHSAYLVNLKHVRKIDKTTVQVANESIPISRHRKKEFTEALLSCLRGEIL